MCLCLETPKTLHCDSSVDDRTVWRVPVAHGVGFAFCCGMEPGMMTLAHYDDSDLGHVFRIVEISACVLYSLELCFYNIIRLAFKYP